jgi:hypothetical protein
MRAKGSGTNAAMGIVAVCLWTLLPFSLHAQRGGRPDAVQNYLKSIPDATLRIRFNEQKVDWRVPDLARQPFVSINAKDSKLQSMRTYTGIRLTALLPPPFAATRDNVYEIHHGFFRTRRFRGSDFDPESAMLIADDRNDHFANRLSPIRFIIASPTESVVIDDVGEIVVKRASSSQDFHANTRPVRSSCMPQYEPPSVLHTFDCAPAGPNEVPLLVGEITGCGSSRRAIQPEGPCVIRRSTPMSLQ